MKISLAVILLILVASVQTLAQTSDDRSVLKHPELWYLDGSVTDLAGRPIQGAEIVVDARETFTASADAHGHFVIQGNKSGSYSAFAEKTGYVAPQIRRVQLLAGMRVTLNLQLDRESVLVGRTLTVDKNPLAGTQIQVWAQGFRKGSRVLTPRGSAISDSMGRYRVAGLSEGTYFVGATTQQIEPHEFASGKDEKEKRKLKLDHPPLFYYGAASFAAATPVYLRSSEQRDGIDFIFEKVPTFCAVASFSYGVVRPSFPIIMVTLAEETVGGWPYGVGNGRLRRGKRFEMCGLSPGIKYVLSVEAFGEASKVGGVADLSFEGDSRDVAIGFRDLGSLLLHAGQAVHGKATIASWSSDKPFPTGVFVTLESLGMSYLNETREVEVQRSGEFVLPSIFHYSHSLRVFGLPRGYYVREARCGRYDLAHDLWQPGCGDINLVLSADGASLYGRAVDDNGQPVDHVQVILVPKDNPAEIAAQLVNQEGDFEFASLAPGKYDLIALADIPEGQEENPEFLRSYSSYATQLNLAASDQQTVTVRVVHTTP